MDGLARRSCVGRRVEALYAAEARMDDSRGVAGPSRSTAQLDCMTSTDQALLMAYWRPMQSTTTPQTAATICAWTSQGGRRGARDGLPLVVLGDDRVFDGVDAFVMVAAGYKGCVWGLAGLAQGFIE